MRCNPTRLFGSSTLVSESDWQASRALSTFFLVITRQKATVPIEPKRLDLKQGYSVNKRVGPGSAESTLFKHGQEDMRTNGAVIQFR